MAFALLHNESEVIIFLYDLHHQVFVFIRKFYIHDLTRNIQEIGVAFINPEEETFWYFTSVYNYLCSLYGTMYQLPCLTSKPSGFTLIFVQ
jgi:hypothetical protein